MFGLHGAGLTWIFGFGHLGQRFGTDLFEFRDLRGITLIFRRLINA